MPLVRENPVEDRLRFMSRYLLKSKAAPVGMYRLHTNHFGIRTPALNHAGHALQDIAERVNRVTALRRQFVQGLLAHQVDHLRPGCEMVEAVGIRPTPQPPALDAGHDVAALSKDEIVQTGFVDLL